MRSPSRHTNWLKRAQSAGRACRTATSPMRRCGRGWSTPPASSAVWMCSSTTRRSSARIGPLATFDVPRFGRVFPVNVGAPMALIQLALPLLAERRGLIVNITSDAASGAYPGWGPYGASKAALELLTRTLASELREQGVSAVLVDPGDMRTRMHQEAFPGEDISDRPLPEVTVPFWNWLFDQDPEPSAASGSPRSTEDARWLQQA